MKVVVDILRWRSYEKDLFGKCAPKILFNSYLFVFVVAADQGRIVLLDLRWSIIMSNRTLSISLECGLKRERKWWKLHLSLLRRSNLIHDLFKSFVAIVCWVRVVAFRFRQSRRWAFKPLIRRELQQRSSVPHLIYDYFSEKARCHIKCRVRLIPFKKNIAYYSC